MGSSDIVNTVPIIESVSGLKSVSESLENRETDFLPGECMLEGLKLCLDGKIPLFNENFYSQEDDIAI